MGDAATKKDIHNYGDRNTTKNITKKKKLKKKTKMANK